MNKEDTEYWTKIAHTIYQKGNGTIKDGDKYWTRKCSKKGFTTFFLQAMEEVIDLHKDSKLDTSTVMKYNKAELKKDLIKQIKAGKADAARILADLDNMRNNVDEYLIVTVDYKELDTLNADKLLDEEAERRDQKSFLEDEDE